MQFLINIIQILVSVLLVTAVLMQQRGGGLSQVFGGGGGGAYHTRRGMEKIIFQATIVLAGLFLATAVLNLLIQTQPNIPDLEVTQQPITDGDPLFDATSTSDAINNSDDTTSTTE
jgi:preprotein translocase subunit SecG